ncbi:MAG: hypothetical protein KGQ37_09430 [Hyphomicrobiales bacterium]|nr:hypothetical protein [Hyphomicrobiales bacterium]
MNFSDCIVGAADDGLISRATARELIERYEQSRLDLGDDGAARTALIEDMKAASAEVRRRQMLTVKATDAMKADLMAYRDADGRPNVYEAAMRLFEHVGHTGYLSVKGIQDALLSMATTSMQDMLHAFRRSSLTMRRIEPLVGSEIVRAAWGMTKSEEAKAFYGAWRTQAERLRSLFNAAGGDIAWREDWGLPTWHDGIAVQRAGFDKWAAAINPLLDWDKITSPLTGEPIAPASRAATLRHVWESIVSDGWNTREPSARGGGASLALGRQDARFLAFKGPDEWHAYATAYGRGEIQDVLMHHISSMARDVGLMQRLGPNPAAAVQWLKDVVAQEAAFSRIDRPSLYKPSMGQHDAVLAHQHAQINSMYEIARGASQPNGWLASGLNAVGNIEMGSKLGSAVLTHVLINPLLQANARLHYGVPLARMAGDIVAGFKGSTAAEMTQAGMIMQDAMHALGAGAREAGMFNRMVELSKWLPAATTHFSGLTPTVEAMRRSWWFATSSTIAATLERDWADVPPRLRSLMQGFGLDEGDWKVMQASPLATQGAPLLRWQDIMQAPRDAVLAARAAPELPVADVDDSVVDGLRNATAMKYLSMLNGSMEYAVPSSRWRGRSIMSFGMKQGGTFAQIMRSVTMFKGFLASATISHLEALRHELAANRAVGAAAAGANVLALTALGTAVLALKQMSTGKDAPSIDPLTPQGRDTLARGLATSGALSIYGDFLASDQSSYGHSLTEEMAGPTVTGLGDLASAGIGTAKKLLSPAKPGGPGMGEKLMAGAVQAARNNTPVLSTHWALRSAYNRILLDQLQYLADPQAHQRMRAAQTRLARDTGQSYWWPPGSPLPQRAPGLTP